MALVVDEYGGFAGIVTVEDIADEHDPGTTAEITAEGAGRLMAGGVHRRCSSLSRPARRTAAMNDPWIVAAITIGRSSPAPSSSRSSSRSTPPAGTGSRMPPKPVAPRAALRSSSELSVLLAGSSSTSPSVLSHSTPPPTADRCLRAVGVTPVDEVGSAQDSAALRHLVEHSATAGTLDERCHGNLISAPELEQLTVADIVRPDSRPGAVAPDAGQRAIQAIARETGHLRLLVRDGERARAFCTSATACRGNPAPPRGLMRPVLVLDTTTKVYEALRTMRDTRSHLAVVNAPGVATPVGPITLSDVLERLLPRPGTGRTETAPTE